MTELTLDRPRSVHYGAEHLDWLRAATGLSAAGVAERIEAGDRAALEAALYAGVRYDDSRIRPEDAAAMIEAHVRSGGTEQGLASVLVEELRQFDPDAIPPRAILRRGRRMIPGNEEA